MVALSVGPKPVSPKSVRNRVPLGAPNSKHVNSGNPAININRFPASISRRSDAPPLVPVIGAPNENFVLVVLASPFDSTAHRHSVFCLQTPLTPVSRGDIKGEALG